VVLYFADGVLRHAGIVEDASTLQTIRSKWGGNEVHRHKLWEDPARRRMYIGEMLLRDAL
jgi:hypothetical protein